MKKLHIIFLLSLSLIGSAQEIEKQESQKTDFKKNELKLNALYLILGIPEITYERILNEESSVGVSLLFSTERDFAIQYAITPYYRWFFGKKPAAGFFVEGFGMVSTIKTSTSPLKAYYFNNTVFSRKKYTDIALGFSIGGKWITRGGFLFEINGGFGRNLINEDKFNTEKNAFKFVPRFGITAGYRF